MTQPQLFDDAPSPVEAFGRYVEALSAGKFDEATRARKLLFELGFVVAQKPRRPDRSAPQRRA